MSSLISDFKDLMATSFWECMKVMLYGFRMIKLKRKI